MTQKLIIGSLAAAALIAAGCSSSGGGSTAPAGGGTSDTSVSTGSTVSISVQGGHLVGPDGHALYTFSTDTATTFSCTAGCLAVWPPITGTAKAGSGVDQDDLSSRARTDGTMQVTYDGMPLYEFTGDKSAADTNGNGVADNGGKWALAKSDDAATSPSSATSSSSDSGGGGGYGY
jgi:predicted lipoprotein with Yx(FWY)xxD motif